MNPIPLAPMTLDGNYVLLRAENLRLLLPQESVGAPEFLEGTLAKFEGSEGTGLFCVANGQDTRLYMALSEHMSALTMPPADRFLVTPIASADGEIRWCWNEVQPLPNASLPLWPLPSVLVAPYTPVQQFAEVGGHVAFVCSPQKLFEHVFASGNRQ